METELLRGQRSRTHNAVLVEADQLIQSWLEGVDKNGSENVDMSRNPRHAWPSGAAVQLSHGNVAGLWEKIPDLAPLPEGEVDVSARVEWEDGDIRDNARAVVEGLLQKTLRSADEPIRVASENAVCVDPRITMELRHKQVRERRRLKDIERAKSRELQERTREAQRMAEALVRREEEERRRRAKVEEALLNEQMAVIRREMQEQREAERLLSSVQHGSPVPVPNVMEQGEWLVSEGIREKRLAVTRTALMEQLTETEALEAKANLKILSQCFSCWHGAVAKQHASLRKAAAVGNWKILLKTWRAWRGYVRKMSGQREQATMARELQREKMHIDLAHQRYRTALLRKCFMVWGVWSKTRRLERRVQEEKHVCQEKMAALLKAVSQPSAEKPAPMTSQRFHHTTVAKKHVTKKSNGVQGVEPSHRVPELSMWQVARQHVDNLLAEAVKSLDKKDKMEECVEGDTTGEDTRTVSQPSAERPHEQSGVKRLSAVESHPEGHKTEGQVARWQSGAHTSPTRVEDTRDHVAASCTEECVAPLDECTSQPRTGDMPRPEEGVPVSTQCQPPRSQTNSSDAPHNTLPTQPRGSVKHSSKGTTKPIAMTGMEARARELARRREEREHVMRVKETEKLLQAQREQEERERVEREAKAAMAAQRREEKRLAKQQELELQHRQETMAKMNETALNHYRTSQLRRWGVEPWKRLMEATRKQQQTADQHHLVHTLKEAWHGWGHAVARRSAERDKMAADFLKGLLVKRSWRAWREYVVWCRGLEGQPVPHWQKMVVTKVFRAWVRFVKDEATRQHEGEKKARLHHHRVLQRSVLHGWVRFVPLSREDKAREVRRAELRRKVSAWLPDYQPPMDSASVDE